MFNAQVSLVEVLELDLGAKVQNAMLDSTIGI